jgi:hypothetical protein
MLSGHDLQWVTKNFIERRLRRQVAIYGTIVSLEKE